MITLTEDLIRKSFLKNDIDEKYFSAYKTEINRCYNKVMSEMPEDDDNAEYSIQHTDDYIKYYAQEIEKGHNDLWSSHFALSIVYNYSYDRAIWNAMEALETEKEKEKELDIHAKSISNDPTFIEIYKGLIMDFTNDARKIAEKYCQVYKSLIKQGRTQYYAQAYAKVSDEYYDYFCKIYAETYECARKHGEDDFEATCFADFCTELSDYGYISAINDFKKLYHKNWQKDHFYHLICEDYKESHNGILNEHELKEIKEMVYK